MQKLLLAVFFITVSYSGLAQNGFMISGKVIQASTGLPIAFSTIHLIGSNLNCLSKSDGSFVLFTAKWCDSLQIQSIGFKPIILLIKKDQTEGLIVSLQTVSNNLQDVSVGVSKGSGKSFMEKVIARKKSNNPERFHSYLYENYSKNELDIDQIDFQKAKTKTNGLKNILLNTYSAIDSTAREHQQLPIYFSESLSNHYHNLSPKEENDQLIAKKDLGLKTDKLLSKFDKFHFQFNIYEDFLPIFDQSFVSPLNSAALKYYKFTMGDSMVDGDRKLQQVHFTARSSTEKAFSGAIWVDLENLAVQSIDMHLNKSANINFVNDIDYHEDDRLILDSLSDTQVYMPYKIYSEVSFESGLALIGIPVSKSNKGAKFVIRNTTILNKIRLQNNPNNAPINFVNNSNDQQAGKNLDRDNEFWSLNRPDPISDHEKNIYKMIDSLKENNRFQRDIKLVAFAGTGYWDFGKYFRIGPYSSFISNNPREGWRIRLGFWSMSGISKKFNFFGYGAYGSQDRKIKGTLGLKYVWNEHHWTKTSLAYGSDYDFIIDEQDELDKDNLINSLFRKNIPYSRMFIKQIFLKHEQYLNENFSTNFSVGYKEMNPLFDFKYRPINPVTDLPYDDFFAKKIPIAIANINIRYAHKERSVILNYDKIDLGSFYPVVTLGYSYGFEAGNAQFVYHKLNLSVEQKLRLPPKVLLYYKFETGKVFGTLPYLLLNVPAGNAYYVASRYEFNTMIPYEFAADRFASLHARLSLGGMIFDKIPLISKLGWRERISFNSYLGDMTQSNISYNKNSNFNQMNGTPFAEAGIGIENIFHVVSVEYFRRLNYLSDKYATKGGIFLGVTLSF